MSEENSKSVADELDPAINQRIDVAPLPTEGTLRHRQNILVQLPKFIRFNLRIVGLITREKIHTAKQR